MNSYTYIINYYTYTYCKTLGMQYFIIFYSVLFIQNNTGIVLYIDFNFKNMNSYKYEILLYCLSGVKAIQDVTD